MPAKSKNNFKFEENVEEIRIPEGTTKIDNRTFKGYEVLQEVYIPVSVMSIGNEAFKNCYSLEKVDISNGVTSIGDSAFVDCSLEDIKLPDSVTSLGESAFEYCDALKSIDLGNNVDEIKTHAFYGCASLNKIHISDSVRKIGSDAFSGCKSLEKISLPDGVEEIDKNAFSNCENLKHIMYKGQNIEPFLSFNAYGANNFKVIRTLVDKNITLVESMFKKAVSAEHAGKLDKFCEQYPLFGDMSVSSAMAVRSVPVEDELKDLFRAQSKTGHRIPKCIDKLAIAANTLNIPHEKLVENFDICYTKNLLNNTMPFVPNIANRCYYSKEICSKLSNKGLDSLVAETLGRYNISKNEAYKYAADFVVSHMDSNRDILDKVCNHADKFDMKENTTIVDVKKAILKYEALGEVDKINKEYDIDLFKCKCDIPVIKTEYDGRISRVLDFNEETDIMLGAKLGYLTNCCQHLGSAGETAMMHGFINPKAGFWVIEDKNGKVKAQAEIWESSKKTLVFDNIEFANTSGEDYKQRVESLRGDLAHFAEKAGYENIIMGCGYNEFKTNKMEKASKPKLKLTAEEIYILQEDNDADVSFKSVKKAEEYMKTKDYDPNDFVYTDVNGDNGSVYIKHEGVISEYLMKGFDEKKVLSDAKKRNNKHLDDRIFEAESIVDYDDASDRQFE